MQNEVLNFYKKQGKRTVIDKSISSQFSGILSEKVSLVQGLLIHPERIRKENVSVQKENLKVKNPVILENLFRKTKIEKIDDKISLEKKVVATCRNFSMLLVSLLLEEGVPARCRCGFATYFPGGGFEDHWVAEYWSREKKHWVMVDAQMDEYWRKKLELELPIFNNLDLKKGQFFVGGDVWNLYKQNLVDEKICGYSPQKRVGQYYIIGNMLRDFFALNKIEYIYDEISPIMKKEAVLKNNEISLLDSIAYMTKNPDENFKKLRELFQTENSIRPEKVK